MTKTELITLIRPSCEVCLWEFQEAQKCRGIQNNTHEFEINTEAKDLLFGSSLTGFCEYFEPKNGFENLINYSIPTNS